MTIRIQAVVTLLVSATSIAVTLSFVSPSRELAAAADLQGTNEVSSNLQPRERHIVETFDATVDSVVFITNVGVEVGIFRKREVEQGSGSGFIWDKKGHVVTNHHVITESRRLWVTLADQSVYEARVVGYWEDTDTAVLKIDAPPEKLRPIQVGVSNDVRVGMTALAIGNPFGLGHTLTVGVISALGREMRAMNNRRITDMVQTDAAINPGNSGGPLLNSRGELIGMNMAIWSPSGANAGIGFAVPVDTVKRIVSQILAGSISRPGLSVALVSDRWRIGIQNYLIRTGRLRSKLPRGVLLREISESSPLHDVGVRPTIFDEYTVEQLGDLIIGLNENRVRNRAELLNAIDRYKVGDEVELHFLRRGRQLTAKIKLVEIQVRPQIRRNR